MDDDARVYDEPSEKPCRRCGATKPIGEFYRASKTRDGRQARCKACHDAVVLARRDEIRAANRERGQPALIRKRCPACDRTLSAAAFHRNRSTLDGLHWVCKTCRTADPATRAAIEERRRFGQYGIDRETVQQMLEDQDGSCAVCGRAFGATPHIDHAHDDGVVRGLLCMRCNTALGLLRDDPSICRSAAAYLERSTPRADG